MAKGEWSDTYHSYKLRKALSFGNDAVGENLKMFDSYFSNGYFWNISLAKIWRGDVYPYPLAELVRPS